MQRLISSIKQLFLSPVSFLYYFVHAFSSNPPPMNTQNAHTLSSVGLPDAGLRQWVTLIAPWSLTIVVMFPDHRVITICFLLSKAVENTNSEEKDRG